MAKSFIFAIYIASVNILTIMKTVLVTTSENFNAKLEAVLAKSQDLDIDVSESVAKIIHKVRKKGDKALVKYTQKFDGYEINASDLRISEEEIEKSLAKCDSALIEALKIAIKRVEEFHKKQLPADFNYADADGVSVGWRWSPIQSAGIYVPGGTASYPSSVYMNAIPAKLAGVKRIAMVVPTPGGKINDAVLASAKLCGITEIYRVGGAQAIAALAYGSESIAAVDKIVGPGNPYVAEAKRQVYGQVGIDSIAGPTDVTIIADSTANPSFIAADLLAQAEHGVDSEAILLTDSKELAEKVIDQVHMQLDELSRKDIARTSWNERGLVILTTSMDEAAEIANRIAPEHLQIITANPHQVMQKIVNAGAIFLGEYSVEALGDYLAGPSHVLPTSGTARFSSGLSVFDFLKRSSIIKFSESSFAKLSATAALIADAEGLGGHANSLRIRESVKQKEVANIADKNDRVEADKPTPQESSSAEQT
jgi:histidinol dehydrogenase